MSLSGSKRRLVGSYAIAAAGVLAAGLSHRWLVPLIGESPPMRLMLVLVVTLSAWMGGLGPGLFATAAGLTAIVAADDSPTDLAVRLLRFGSLAVLITLLFAGMHAQRRRAEQRHRAYLRSEGRYRRLVEAAGEGIWAIDRDGRTSYANPRLGEILGLPHERLVGRPLADFLVDPGDAPRIRAESADGRSARCEVQLRGEDGRIRVALFTERLIGPDDESDIGLGGRPGGGPPGPGGSIGLLLMVTDITPLKQAERALREKESLLRSFYESSAMAMGVVEVVGDDARIVSANAPTARLFGPAAGAVEGRTARELGMPAARLSDWIDRFRRGQAAGRPARFEDRAPWPAGPDWIAVTLSAMDLPDSAGELCSFIIEDITERKRTEDDLRIAKEAAEAASRAKDRFLAVLSHELRTPLTPVLIAVGSMLDSELDPAIRTALEMIRRNIELEARLIDDLLDLTRIARGRLRLDLEVIDMHRAIRRAVEICRDEVLVAGLKVITRLEARRHHVNADHARVMQIAWNLVRNAARFTPAGGRLIIRTSNRTVAGDDSAAAGRARTGETSEAPGPERLVVEFADDGIGIEPAALPRIFEAFEQGEHDPRGRSRGLGLGLTISRSLAEAMGGRLTASSPGPGLGSTFRLELAAVPAPPPAATEPAGDRAGVAAIGLAAGAVIGRAAASPARVAVDASPAAIADRTGGAGAALRILVVEDNEDTLRYLATMLRKRGHDVVTAGSIAAARDAAGRARAEAPFDLLLSDIELPDGNGMELMRELGARCGIRGIAMSGFGAEEDVRLSGEAGFSEHLTKPLDSCRLDAAIRRAAAAVAGRPEAAPDPPGRGGPESDSGPFAILSAGEP